MINSFSGQPFSKKLEKEQKLVDDFVTKNLNEVRKFALKSNLDLQRTEDGTVVVLAQTGEKELCPVDELPYEEVQKISPILNKIQQGLSDLNEAATIEEEKLMDRLEVLKKQKAASSIGPYMRRLHRGYDKVPGIKGWLKEMEDDILENLSILTNINPEYAEATAAFIEKRYAVNLLVSNDPTSGPKVLLEPNPSYENLFGSIKYHATPSGDSKPISP
ncbi:MAG: AAA family ATPase [Holosporaceae bacterium]|nr:MAG: AAA family ATPase [Holosporaceae bacterium]